MALKIAAVELMIFQGEQQRRTFGFKSCMGPPLLQTKLRVEERESRQQRPIWTQQGAVACKP